MQEKNITWIAIVSEIHAIKQQLEMINISEIIGKASIKCSEVGITINYEDPLQSLRSNNLYDPKLFCQELKEKSINNIIKDLIVVFRKIASLFRFRYDNIYRRTFQELYHF